VVVVRKLFLLRKLNSAARSSRRKGWRSEILYQTDYRIASVSRLAKFGRQYLGTVASFEFSMARAVLLVLPVFQWLENRKEGVT